MPPEFLFGAAKLLLQDVFSCRMPLLPNPNTLEMLQTSRSQGLLNSALLTDMDSPFVISVTYTAWRLRPLFKILDLQTSKVTFLRRFFKNVMQCRFQGKAKWFRALPVFVLKLGSMY